MRKTNPWKILSSYPPVLVRLLARRRIDGKHVRAISTEEVAILAGLPLPRVREISAMTAWDAVTVGEAERFCLACGFDPLNATHRNRYRAYERGCRIRPQGQWFAYLRSSPWWQSEFIPLIQRWKAALANNKDLKRAS